MNKLNELIDKLAGHKSVFEPIYILCSERSIQPIIKEKLAEKAQISANLKFFTPEEFIEIISSQKLGKRQDYIWAIYKALKTTKHEEISQYISGDSIKQYDLAKVLAGLFINYDKVQDIDIPEEWQRTLYENLKLCNDKLRLSDMEKLKPQKEDGILANEIYSIETDELQFYDNQIRDCIERYKIKLWTIDLTLPALMKIPENTEIDLVSCYTPAREVEVFHDYLVKYLSENQNISPSDILVQVTQPHLYFPLIKGVFESARVRLPYSIHDFEPDQSRGFQVIEEFLKLDSNLIAEDVMSFAELPSIQERFSFQDIKKLREICIKACVRFGYKNSTKNESYLLSWSHFFDRIILGFCLDDEFRYPLEDETTAGLMNIVEGTDINDILKLKHLIELLNNATKSETEENLVSKHLEVLQTSISELISDVDLYGLESLNVFLNTVKDIKTDRKTFKFMVLDYIEAHRNNFSSSKKGVRFESIYQPNYEPKKLLGFLGLNAADFPKRDKKYSFNALSNNRDFDQYQNQEKDFRSKLDTGEKLFFSYRGKSSKNNQDQLISPIILSLLPGRKAIQHPLHSFSTLYNSKEDLFSYHYGEDEDEEEKIEETARELDRKEEKELELNIDDFLTFWKDPLKNFYTKNLGIYLGGDSEELPRYETVIPDTLKKWQVKTDLVQSDIDNDYRLNNIEHSNLGLSYLSEIQVDKLSEEVKDLRNRFQEKTNSSTPISQDIDLILEVNNENGNTTKVNLKGKIDKVFEKGIIDYTVSKSKLKYKIPFFLKYLILKSNGNDVMSSYLLNVDGEYVPILNPQEDALDILKNWIQIYFKAQVTFQKLDLGLLEKLCNNMSPFDFGKENAEVDFQNKIQDYMSDRGTFPSEYLKYELELGGEIPMDLYSKASELNISQFLN